MKTYDIVRIHSLDATKAMVGDDVINCRRPVGDVGVIRIISGEQVWLYNGINPYNYRDLTVIKEAKTVAVEEIRYRIHAYGIGCVESFTDVKEALEYLEKKNNDDPLTHWQCVAQYETVYKSEDAYV